MNWIFVFQIFPAIADLSGLAFCHRHFTDFTGTSLFFWALHWHLLFSTAQLFRKWLINYSYLSEEVINCSVTLRVMGLLRSYCREKTLILRSRRPVFRISRSFWKTITFKNRAKGLFLNCGSNNTGAYILRYF